MIRVDASATSAVATCSACPSWRVLRGDRLDALAAAADHDRAVHDSGVAGRALAEARRRRS